MYYWAGGDLLTARRTTKQPRGFDQFIVNTPSIDHFTDLFNGEVFPDPRYFINIIYKRGTDNLFL